MVENITLLKVYKLLQKMEAKMDKKYATKSELRPVKTLVYGFTSLILIGVISAWMAQVIIANGGI